MEQHENGGAVERYAPGHGAVYVKLERGQRGGYGWTLKAEAGHGDDLVDPVVTVERKEAVGQAFRIAIDEALKADEYLRERLAALGAL
jgi:hypothetical protein